MNNLRKDQIIVLASLGGLFTLVIILTYVRFFMDDGEVVEENSSISILPTAPDNPEIVYDTRIERAEEIRREEERKKRIENAKSEIDLNVFKSRDSEKSESEETTSPLEVPESETEEKVVKQRSITYSQTTEKRTTTKVSDAIKEESVQINQPEIDPDLYFADPTFTTSNNQQEKSNSETNSEIRIPAVIQDDVTVTNGGRVTIRTTDQVSVNGHTIPKNTYIQTIARFGRRLNLEVPPITADDGIVINEKLVVIDANDNNEGIYSQELIDSEITRDQTQNIANELARESSNSLVRSGLRSISNKKVQEVKVTLRRNQPIFIQSQK
ncbi:MAG: conjugative transposon protein TraM [Balneola sp.]